MKCKVCSQEAPFFDNALVLQKHTVSYFKCASCGFVQTEEPHWLQESYAEAINRADVGLVDRNLGLARTARSIIPFFFNADAKFIDYGGGYGLFVRMMRDYGFDFYWHDLFCDNLFARGFAAEPSLQDAYELLTAFEVFEHMSDPIEEVGRMLKLSRNILFTTLVLPRNAPKPNEWWYYQLDQGQHVSFYTLKSLSILAEKFRVKLYSDGRSLHLLSGKRRSSPAFIFLSYKSKLLPLLRMLWGRKSLIPSDYKAITGKELSWHMPDVAGFGRSVHKNRDKRR
jgi:hypothetical protein